MTEPWFIEKHTPHAGLTLAVRERLHDAQSSFQHIEVLDTVEYGRMLLLDGYVMLTERDEFIYHEMIVHPALLMHPDPRRVLIIGGGDGGSVREVLRHEKVTQVSLVEIDYAVIETSRRFFPAVSVALDHPKVAIECRDGFDFLDEHPNTFDVILVDSIDPVGEAAKLFTPTFYQKVRNALREGGCAVLQTESPFYHSDVLRRVQADLRPIFPHVSPYLAHIPTYPSGLWSFTFAATAFDPRTFLDAQATEAREQPAFLADLNYFTLEVAKAAFALPAYIRKAIAPPNG